MIKTVFVSNDEDFSLHFGYFLNTVTSLQSTKIINSKNDCIEFFFKNNPDLLIIDFDSMSIDSMFLIRELLQMIPLLKILLITTGLSLDLLKSVKQFTNLQILYKPFNKKMFYEKL